MELLLRAHGGSTTSHGSPAPAKAALTAAARKTEAPAKSAKPAAPKTAAAKPAVEKAPAAAKPAVPRPAVTASRRPGAAPKPGRGAEAGRGDRRSAQTAIAPHGIASPGGGCAARPPAPPSQDRRPILPDRLPPRPLGKAEIFVEGDHVVYPTHGVGKVERIATEEIAGHKLELIHITFEENRMTLRVPVAKARTAGLRKLATRKLFDEALAVLKGRARIKRTMWSRRAQEYEAKINSGDPLAIAEVVRDLHRNAGQPDQSFSERQIYEAAMDRLAAELAALDKTDKMTAATKLTNFLKTV